MKNYPFDLALARDCKWPLVNSIGQKIQIVKWDSWHPDGDYPLCGITYLPCGSHRACHWNREGKFDARGVDDFDLFLSSDLTDPDVRAAVQAAHEKLGRPCVVQDAVTRTWHNEPPYHWDWQYSLYALTEHLPAPDDPIAPGHNPDKLTVSQVGDGYRIVDQDEVMRSMRVRVALPVERWEISCWADDSRIWGMFSSKTYRTQLSREAFAALDKPAWSLPDPPAGKQWHRNDFIEADLPPVTDGGSPWRPLLLGEPNEEGDEHSWNHITWNKHDNSRGAKATNTMNWYRTRRPLPSSPTFVPWDFESAPIMVKARRKKDEAIGLLFPLAGEFLFQFNVFCTTSVSYTNALSDFTLLDGTPCGKQV